MHKSIKYMLVARLVIASISVQANKDFYLDDSYNINNLPANQPNQTQLIVDFGWGSKYLAEGGNNLKPSRRISN